MVCSRARVTWAACCTLSYTCGPTLEQNGTSSGPLPTSSHPRAPSGCMRHAAYGTSPSITHHRAPPAERERTFPDAARRSLVSALCSDTSDLPRLPSANEGREERQTGPNDPDVYIAMWVYEREKLVGVRPEGQNETVSSRKVVLELYDLWCKDNCRMETASAVSTDMNRC